MKNLPPTVQRWLIILMPPVALLVCCGVVVPRQNKLRELNTEIKATQAEADRYLAQLRAISSLPPDPTLATMPLNKLEQTTFLRGLADLCKSTGNHMISINALAMPPGPPPAPLPGGPPPLPEGVVAIKSTIMFEGNFNSLREFLTGLNRSRRLISMSDCRVSAARNGYPMLQTALTVTRYVDVPVAPAPPQPPKT